jgi:hypothetical protein
MTKKQLKKFLNTQCRANDSIDISLQEHKKNLFKVAAELSVITTINEMTEKHMQLAESELNRKEVIIGYLEERNLELSTRKL